MAELSYVGYVLTIVALSSSPPDVERSRRLLRPLLNWWRPVEGSLAGDSLLQVPERTSGAILALMFSLALTIAFAGMARAAYASVVVWLDTTMNPDLLVLPSQRLELHAMRFPPSMAGELPDPGVGRCRRIAAAGRRLTASRSWSWRSKWTVFTARPGSNRSRGTGTALRGRGRRPWPSGVRQSRPAPRTQTRGPRRIAGTRRDHQTAVVGVLPDYTDQQGTIFLDRSVFLKFWRDDAVSDFRIFVAAGADPAAVRRRIIERFAGQQHVFVMTNGEFRSYVLGTVDRWFQLIDLQMGVAVVIAILGIVNALTVSITDRRREFGVLKAVGALRGQIRRTIWLEAICVATIGLILGRCSAR